MAKLYKESLSNKNSWSFVEFETNLQQPHLLLDAVWTPMLNPEKAVPSSIELGGNQVAKNALFSGPNAAGKSTTMKAITLAIVFAQTFGIAPARRMIFTPFNSINTYLNISDDIAQGRSRFKMEAYRAQDLVKRIESMPVGEFVFSIMDETFSGTDPREGAAAGYSILRYLSEAAPQSMVIAASHYPLLKTLEKHTNGAIKNFKVEAEINPISYPFSLKTGSSNQIIALELLQEEGMEITKELKYVREILKQSELFEKE
jgi:DNA mismatch repair protein MutS